MHSNSTVLWNTESKRGIVVIPLGSSRKGNLPEEWLFHGGYRLLNEESTGGRVSQLRVTSYRTLIPTSKIKMREKSFERYHFYRQSLKDFKYEKGVKMENKPDTKRTSYFLYKKRILTSRKTIPSSYL
jgi:hypothetical protein